MNEKTPDAVVTAGIVAIGDELLSGRTKDRNIAYLADFLTVIGIDLKEARIVGDEEPAIVEAVNTLSQRYDYVFTCGGIGPTHDDITADAIGAAFGLAVDEHAPTAAMLAETYAERGIDFTPARRRMARLPVGAEPIENAVSKAPGFRVENVHVMAGVPSIFQAMLEAIAPTLATGAKTLSRTIDCPFPEGAIGERLGAIQASQEGVAIGSYPRYDGKTFSTQIVLRSRDPELLDATETSVRAMLEELKAG